MPTLDSMVFGNPILNWFLGIGLAAVTVTILLVLRRILFHRLRRFAANTETKIDDLFVEVFSSTRIVAMVAAGLYVGASVLTFPDGTERILGRTLVVILFLQCALWGNAAIGFFRKRMADKENGRDPAAAAAVAGIAFIARVFLWGFITLLVLDNLGVNVTGLVAGLGIGGVAVALALQNILGDLFASMSILLDKPFVIGDFIVVDDQLGTIEHIGLKTTRLRSLSGEQIVIANADLLSSRIRNFKRMAERRVVLAIDITYQTPAPQLATARTIIRESIREQPGTRLDRVHFREFGPSSLRFEAVYFVLDPEYNRFMDVQESVNLKIFERFAEAGIEFAYPTQTLFVRGIDAGHQAGKEGS